MADVPKIIIRTPAAPTPPATKAKGAGRQHLIHLTVGELNGLVRPADEIAVSQASLRKLIGDAGVRSLLEQQKAKG